MKTLEEVRHYVPIFSRDIMKSTIPNLKVRFIDLFDMTDLSPYNLKKISEDLDRFKYGLKNLNICHQFAVFRHMYDENLIAALRVIDSYINGYTNLTSGRQPYWIFKNHGSGHASSHCSF